MLNAILCFAVLASAPQDQRVEYTFKSDLARFVNTRWKDLAKHQMPDVQVAETAEGKPTGIWIYFDLKNNKVILGSRDDTAQALAGYLELFDLQPIKVKLAVRLTRADLGLDLKSTLETDNNRTCFVGADDAGALVNIRARVNADGKVNVRVELRVGDKSAYAVASIEETSRFDIDEGKAAITRIKTPETGEAILFQPQGELWKPFKIEVRAEPVMTK